MTDRSTCTDFPTHFVKNTEDTMKTISDLPSGLVAVATCERRENRVDQRDQDEGPTDSPRGSSKRLWHRPVVPPSAFPVPTTDIFRPDYARSSTFVSRFRKYQS